MKQTGNTEISRILKGTILKDATKNIFPRFNLNVAALY